MNLLINDSKVKVYLPIPTLSTYFYLNFDLFQWNVLSNAIGSDVAKPVTDFGTTILEKNNLIYTDI